MNDEMSRLLDKVCAAAARPKGYSQSHARKIWRESTTEHAMRAFIYGSSTMKVTSGEFPRLTPLNGPDHE